MFERNVITPLIQGFVTFVVIAVGAFAIITIAYVVIDIWRDNKRFHRKQVLRGYERAGLIMEYRREASEITGVVYSKGRG